MNFLLLRCTYHIVYSVIPYLTIFSVDLGITETDLAVMSTDYKSYMVTDACAPNIRNCGRIVDVFSRVPFASRNLIRKLDRLVVERLGLDPGTFVSSQRRGVRSKLNNLLV